MSGEANSETMILERIRGHCDSGLRYYTWALANMPDIPEQAAAAAPVTMLRSALALVLAYVEGAIDERSALSAREDILRRYTTAIQVEGWNPPFSAEAIEPKDLPFELQ